MEYHIALEEFELDCIIGILPVEREKAQKIRIDAEFVVEKSEEFLDYCLLKNFIKDAFDKEFQLLEDAHDYFLATLPKSFPQVKTFWIKITKLEIFSDCKVAITTHYKGV
ncbi:dihydroneopterin aldolase [Helicobacter sp. MIT 11-5569]|uniref:dihydroneopterin aldolase n=1 Tax=Helicobacter sp. MIT 11-5569 TaxID=1548151 RepID=UPI00051FC261|nr:dihydroneopterin aldolase [Helicobacter sp. MIT 11-5569]TLD84478.1 dihydroneopterin aldolase [Helicobacter sp. MIT 11-5569]